MALRFYSQTTGRLDVEVVVEERLERSADANVARPRGFPTCRKRHQRVRQLGLDG